MDWQWFGATSDLRRWEERSYSVGVEAGPGDGDKRDRHEREVALEMPGPPEADGVARRLADAILRFDVFPPRLLTGVLRRRPVEIGDAVGLQYPVVPGLKLFFAARVIDRFEETTDTLWRCGFSYRTLQGHPACGEETFVVEKELATGKVTVALRSWSRPGLWIARMTYPIMRTLQVRAARAALDHLERLAKPDAPLATSELLARRNLRTSLL